jgi:hypothetical protein
VSVDDLESKRFWRDFEKRVFFIDPSLPFEKIKRYRGGAANESSVDLIELGEARESVMALFSRYGFQEPKNWAELRGNHIYIETLESCLDGVRIGCRGDLAAGLRFVRDFRPQFCEPVEVCMTQGYEGLQSFHNERGTFQKNADAYDEGAELPDKEYSDEDNEWPEHLR